MKLIGVLLAISILGTSVHARADFPEFEPSIVCLAGAAGGYMMSDVGNEMLYAGIGCAAGYFVGAMINDHYEAKYTAPAAAEVKRAQQVIDSMIDAQAKSEPGKSAKTGWYRLKIKTVKGGKMPNGSVRKATEEAFVESPGSTDDVNIRFGR